jgi:para-aminobenzoate synthetase component I
MNRQQAIDSMNEMGKRRVPFLFIIDFDMEKPVLITLNEINPDEILYSVNGVTNCKINTAKNVSKVELQATPVSEQRYFHAFDHVQKHIKHGDSFLLNLTMPSKIETNLCLKEIFENTNAKYKLWIKDKFVVFSPEIFIQIQKSKISSFPMKGTIDAMMPDAENKLLNSEKELAEHYTIVDLIRNDLSMVAKNVEVESFRNIDKVVTNKGALLQMSSKIIGDVPKNSQEYIGTLIFSMLPAGSISGAPKKKTIEIIKQAENYDRGYYTGIMGIYDGCDIDSGVMIRYVEQTEDGLMYKSGGGITAKSNPGEEYQELIDKIYIPFTKK